MCIRDRSGSLRARGELHAEYPLVPVSRLRDVVDREVHVVEEVILIAGVDLGDLPVRSKDVEEPIRPERRQRRMKLCALVLEPRELIWSVNTGPSDVPNRRYF